MARTVNEEKYAEKRNEILNVVQRLVMVKGYEQMTIQDILKELDISSGAFYHYFDSKTAILEAFIERIREETEKPLLPILHDPQLSALEKLRGFFEVLDRIRSENRDDIIQLARVWYTDENAIVRQKVDEAMMQQRGPLLTEVVRQGLAEGVFQTSYPEMSGEVILSLMQAMGNAHARIFFSEDTAQGDQARIEAIVAVYDAYMDAIERTLGAPAGSLRRLDIEAVQKWVTATSKGQIG